MEMKQTLDQYGKKHPIFKTKYCISYKKNILTCVRLSSNYPVKKAKDTV